MVAPAPPENDNQLLMCGITLLVCIFLFGWMFFDFRVGIGLTAIWLGASAVRVGLKRSAELKRLKGEGP